MKEIYEDIFDEEQPTLKDLYVQFCLMNETIKHIVRQFPKSDRKLKWESGENPFFSPADLPNNPDEYTKEKGQAALERMGLKK